MWNKILAILAMGVLFQPAFSQQPTPGNFGNLQPYVPTVVGGLPPGSKGLEQPVYVADRSQSIGFTTSSDPQSTPTPEFSDFDESKARQSQSKSLGTRFEAGTLVAYVGNEPITIGDLIDPSKATEGVMQQEQFVMRLRMALAESINRKCLARHFLADKSTGKSVKDRQDANKQIQAKTNKVFFEKVLPGQMEKFKCTNLNEFQDTLQKMGATVDSLKREFTESTWAQEAIRESVPEKQTVELSEIQDFYEDHITDWKRPTRVRYRQLSAIYSKYPNKEAAYAAIVQMGNEVLYGGAQFEAVAKRSSTGFGASNGGVFDWTSMGALKSKVIENAIFSYAKGGLSPILEDADGYHIVEVLDRDEEHIVSFVDAQREIRKKLETSKYDEKRKEFVRSVREKTDIYTMWPEDIPGSHDLSELK